MRRVFVTGGADGIGKTIVKAFRMAGHRVAFVTGMKNQEKIQPKNRYHFLSRRYQQ